MGRGESELEGSGGRLRLSLVVLCYVKLRCRAEFRMRLGSLGQFISRE